MKRLLLLATLALVAGCGRQTQLRPKTGETMPPKPAMASEAPTPDQLLTPGPEARPERNIELVRRSRERAEDPFDLPPGR